jgi:hypothetical protein
VSNLEKHAEFELIRAGLFAERSDYGGVLGNAVMKMIRVFAEEGHSGGSASIALAAFERLARFKTLTPITSNPEEWTEIHKDMSPAGLGTCWQSRRCPSCFSYDGGKTYYDIDAGDDRAMHTSEVSS